MFIQTEATSNHVSTGEIVLAIFITLIAIGIIIDGRLLFQQTGYKPPQNALLSKSSQDRSIARWKIGYFAMPLLLVCAWWGALGGPLVPKLVGTVINLLYTHANFLVVKNKITERMSQQRETSG